VSAGLGAAAQGVVWWGLILSERLDSNFPQKETAASWAGRREGEGVCPATTRGGKAGKRNLQGAKGKESSGLSFFAKRNDCSHKEKRSKASGEKTRKMKGEKVASKEGANKKRYRGVLSIVKII